MKIVSREKISRLDEVHTKFMLSNLKNLNGYAEERLTFLYIVSKLDISSKESLYEELASDENEDIALTALEHLAEFNKARAVKLLEKKIKMAGGDDHRSNLKALLDSLEE